MDMVDSALERPDVALSQHGTIGLNRVPLRALRSCFLTQNRVAGPVSFNPYRQGQSQGQILNIPGKF